MYSVVLAALLTGGSVPDQGYDSGVRQSLQELRQGIQELKREQAYFRLQELRDTIDSLRREQTDVKIAELRRMIEHMSRGQSQQSHQSGGSSECRKEMKEHMEHMRHMMMMHHMMMRNHGDMMEHMRHMRERMRDRGRQPQMPGSGSQRPGTRSQGGTPRGAGGSVEIEEFVIEPEQNLEQIGSMSNRALITVEAPPGAALGVEQVTMPFQLGSSSFVTPMLQPGKDYYYDLRVSVPQDGKIVTRGKRVLIRAGSRVTVAFRDMTPIPIMKPARD